MSRIRSSHIPTAIKEDISRVSVVSTYQLAIMIILSLFICSLIFTAACGAPAEGECDKTKCKGPLQYYKELSCEPVYKNKDDCCPYKYNCENIKNRPTDKCYLNGHEYNIGDQLKEEDANPCDVDCSCRMSQGVAEFTCAVVDCFQHPKFGCYLVHSPFDCCPTEVCPEKDEELPVCEVDGKKYNVGDYFSPADEPEKDCSCAAGYKGENVKPFCKTRRPSVCGMELRRAYEIHNNCPPVFYNSQSPQTDCAVSFRCQNDKDEVITPATKSAGTEEKSDEDMICNFGNITMKLGEELNQKTDWSSVCVKCVCEVPPIPTCQHLPDDVCDITKHPKFD